MVLGLRFCWNWDVVEGFLSLVKSGKYGTGTLVIRLEPWVCFGAWTCVRGRKGCAGVLDLGGRGFFWKWEKWAKV